MEIDNRKDILLLLLYSPGVNNIINEPVTGRTRLVKMVFLFQKEIMNDFKKNFHIEEEKTYQFFPWNFGPFSKEVYNDISFFILREFIESSNIDKELIEEAIDELDFYYDDVTLNEEEINVYQEEEFKLTEKGINFANELYMSLSIHQKKLLKDFKSRIVSIPLRALLRYVYQKYPETTNKSRIKESV